MLFDSIFYFWPIEWEGQTDAWRKKTDRERDKLFTRHTTDDSFARICISVYVCVFSFIPYLYMYVYLCMCVIVWVVGWKSEREGGTEQGECGPHERLCREAQ